MTATEQRNLDAAPAEPMVDALAPVRRAILESARRDAADTIERANRAAQELRRRAAAEADTIRETARAEGRHDAEQVRVEQRARARRRARSIVLQAQRQALDDLTSAVHDAVRRLWCDPATQQAVRATLVATARAEHGPQAVITDHPDGGVVATIDHARATYLLTDLADEVIASLGDDIVGLWTP